MDSARRLILRRITTLPLASKPTRSTTPALASIGIDIGKDVFHWPVPSRRCHLASWAWRLASALTCPSPARP